MPVSASGVMLVEYSVPNADFNGRPPANEAPSGAVWQTLQLPIAESCAPRATSLASNRGGGLGGSRPAERAACHASVAQPAASASSKALPRRPKIGLGKESVA